MVNSFGNLFRITSFGESHGEGIGVVIDGCPAGIALDSAYIQSELDRRKPGQSRITTQRKEADEFQLFSGHVDNTTTGAPLCFFVPNTNAKSKDYNHLAQTFRPSHADYTYYKKYGIRDHRGGGRSSARETVARVIGGAVAKLYLQQVSDITIEAWVHAIHELSLQKIPQKIELNTAYQKAVRCPDAQLSEEMYHLIDRMRKSGDSVGGIIACRVKEVPVGLGEPIYQKIHAMLGSAMLSINAVKGFEIGSGFEGTRMTGSAHNDEFYMDSDQVKTRTNYSGGVQGGITNGEEIYFKVAFKPTSTIMRNQQSVNADGEAVTVEGKGRHDPCVVPRAVPIVEAMTALVLADYMMIHHAKEIKQHNHHNSDPSLEEIEQL